MRRRSKIITLAALIVLFVSSCDMYGEDRGSQYEIRSDNSFEICPNTSISNWVNKNTIPVSPTYIIEFKSSDCMDKFFDRLKENSAIYEEIRGKKYRSVIGSIKDGNRQFIVEELSHNRISLTVRLR